MTAKELIQQGKPEEALAALLTEVRAKPADAKLRVFLFQLLAVKGDWDRALTHLNVSKDLDPSAGLMAEVCRPALAAEALRAEIFAGKRTPLLLGEPEEWVGWLLEANKLFSQGHYEGAAELREKAFEAAPTTTGTLNGQPFEWIADADMRFGPMLEAIISGKYYWVPFARIKEITIEPPTDLRDLVWAPAIITYSTGTPAVALIPTRYPGTEASGDGPAMLGRKTDWVEKGGISVGIGQRLIATDAGETPILECKSIQLNTESPVAGGSESAEPAPSEG